MSGLLGELERWWAACDGTLVWWLRSAWLAALALARGEVEAVDAVMAAPPPAFEATLRRLPLACGSWACWLERTQLDGLERSAWVLDAARQYGRWTGPCPGGADHRARRPAPWATDTAAHTLGWLREAAGTALGATGDHMWWGGVVWQVMALLEGEAGVDLVLDYLADHLEAHLQGPAPCSCGAWRCWVRGCPLDPASRLEWLLSLVGVTPRPTDHPRWRWPSGTRLVLGRREGSREGLTPLRWPRGWLVEEGWTPAAGTWHREIGCSLTLPPPLPGGVEARVSVERGVARVTDAATGALLRRVDHGGRFEVAGRAFTFYAATPPGTLECTLCRDLSTIWHVPTAQAKLRLGRVAWAGGVDNDLVLFQGALSRRHCVLTWQDAAWEVRDEATANGTWVNDARITAPTRLAPGDVVRIGDFELRLHGAVKG